MQGYRSFVAVEITRVFSCGPAHSAALGEGYLIYSGQCEGRPAKFSEGSITNVYLQALEH